MAGPRPGRKQKPRLEQELRGETRVAPRRAKHRASVVEAASPSGFSPFRSEDGTTVSDDLESIIGSDGDEGEDIVGSTNSDYGDYIDSEDDTSRVEERPDSSSQHQSSDHGNSAAETYINSLKTSSGLHIAERRRVEKAFEDHGELGLFSLFITREFKKRIQNWTNEGLKQHGQKETTDHEFDAYIGLELAMSICPLSEISEFWSEKRFVGQKDFSQTMNRARFQAIRARVKFHLLDMSSGDGNDPLWHSRIILEHMQKRFAQIAVPYGVSSFDECSVRTKARTRAKSYMPSKPDKYAIRFYASVGWASLYVHSVWDNGSGNWSRTTPIARYTKFFPSLTDPVNRTLVNPDIAIKKESASALWVAMMGHQASTVESPSGRRLMVTDNFYTRDALAKALSKFSDGETRLVGTVRENNVDNRSKSAAAAAIKRVEAAPRGAWELIAVQEQEDGYTQRKQEHTKSQRNIPKQSRSKFPPPRTVFAPNAGYIVFKDRKVVLFYMNDLAKTPTKFAMTPENPDAIECVHGLFPIKRWTSNENLHKKTFMVPAVIAAYNTAMNGVDRVDQLRSTNPTRRKEMRLAMSIFTWALDMCVINAFALFQEVTPTRYPKPSLREFKRRIAEQLTAKQLEHRDSQRSMKRKKTETGPSGVVGGILSGHIVTPNSTVDSDGQLKCLLCRMRGFQKRSRFCCAECQVGFHVECLRHTTFKMFFVRHRPQVSVRR